MLRPLSSTLVALVLLAVPYSGGGSGRSASPTRPAVRTYDDEGEPPLRRPLAAAATPAASDPSPAASDHFAYPRFVRSRTGEPVSNPRLVQSPERELVLSFDDGPDLLGTPVVLQELDKRGLKAIFFVNGRYMVGSRPQDLARRDLVRKLASHGHLVANHTLTHRNLCHEPDQIEHEIDGNAEIIAAATGVRPQLFRSPYGSRCRRLDEALHARDLIHVGWNIDAQEWRGGEGDEELVYEYVTKALGRLPGAAILLLHDTHSGAVRALPRILDWIQAENGRVAREGGRPIVMRDYTVFFPVPPPLETGLEPFLADLRGALSVLPGLGGPRLPRGGP